MPSARLKRDTVEVRGEVFTIRQWTASERAEYVKRSRDDALLGSVYIVHRCTLREDGTAMWPKESDAGGEPTEITDAITAAIVRLSEGEDVQKNA